MNLYPTPTRLALLRAVDAGKVVYGAGPDSSGIHREPAAWRLADADTHLHKVTSSVEDFEREGWIVRPDRTAVWMLTNAGRAVLAAAEVSS